MKKVISLLLLFSLLYPGLSYSQKIQHKTGRGIEDQLKNDTIALYSLSLKKGEYAEFTLLQKGIDIAIDVLDPLGNKLGTFDSPNGDQGPEPVQIAASVKGAYKIKVYPMQDPASGSVSVGNPATLSSKGSYSISDLKILTASEYHTKLLEEEKDKKAFGNWISANAHPLETVDPGNGFADLQPYKSILKDVRVVGMGEATHGSSEFFRMKHRMIEFLVKEMDFTSFYIEASMTRCRYINDYVIYGKGSLDTATAIQGFVTWRVGEVRDLIEWMREYNSTVSPDKKVKFIGYDLQINNLGWEDLKSFYLKVNSSKLSLLDSLQNQADSASVWSGNFSRIKEGSDLFKRLYPECLLVMNDMLLNKGRYQWIAGKELFDFNLMNIKLIIEEIESYQNGYNNLRDYYMAENILEMLNSEKPGSKIIVWAHNMHIAKIDGSMGGYLEKVLHQDYYAIGFEFNSGSFQSRDLDSGNNSRSWDIITVQDPPVESLPWYFNQSGKEKFYIDFRNTGSNEVRNFGKSYNVHSFGSMVSKNWPETYSGSLSFYDGMIFIRKSTAAVNFTRVIF